MGMIKTDDVVVAQLNGRRYVTLVTSGQREECDPKLKVLDPEEPGAVITVTVDDVELMTQEHVEEILGV